MSKRITAKRIKQTISYLKNLYINQFQMKFVTEIKLATSLHLVVTKNILKEVWIF